MSLYRISTRKLPEAQVSYNNFPSVCVCELMRAKSEIANDLRLDGGGVMCVYTTIKCFGRLLVTLYRTPED